MDTSFVTVCLIVVGSVFIPFFLFSSAGRNGRKKIKAQIKLVVTQNNLNISESENWGNMYIGLDTEQGKFLFLKLQASENLEQLIDLNTISGCQITEKRKVIKTHGKKEMLLEKLDLKILHKNGDNLILNFYDMDEDRKEDFELQRIEKWKALVIAYLSAVPFGEKAA